MGVKDLKSSGLSGETNGHFKDHRNALDEFAKSFGDENFYDLSEIGGINKAKPHTKKF